MKTYVVLPVADLLKDQPFVYFDHREIAEKVAQRFAREPGSDAKYTWSWNDARDRRRPDAWAVVAARWAVVPLWDVKPLEYFVGTWKGGHWQSAQEAADELMSGSRKTADFIVSGTGPREGDYVAVVQRNLAAVRRRDLAPGDCFVYLDHTLLRRIVADAAPSDMPALGWMLSTELTASAAMNQQVFRVPRWSTKPAVTPAPSVSTRHTMVDILEAELAEVLVKKIGGVDGKELLWRYENAMHAESLVRHDGGLVSTHGDYPLSADQARLASAVWGAKGRLEVERARAAAAEKERNRVTCDNEED